MRIERLRTVDAFIAFDLEDVELSAGGTRLAPDVTEEEVALLARAMTYKFGVLGAEMGGAKGAVRADPADPTARQTALGAYCEEIRPLVDARRFLTGPDLGTTEADFASLRPPGGPPSLMAALIEGVAAEDLVTGFGVMAAAEAALGTLDGAAVAIEGFGKVGGGVAREAVRRGARVVAVSTVAGAVHDPDGLDVGALWAGRAAHGDQCVADQGRPLLPREALFEVEADVLVPGARTGVIDVAVAASLSVRCVAPAANVPYREGATAVLHERGVLALADFICNAGAVIGYRSPTGTSFPALLEVVDARIAGLVAETVEHPDGPFRGACEAAERFIAGWRGANGLPPGPPLA